MNPEESQMLKISYYITETSNFIFLLVNGKIKKKH